MTHILILPSWYPDNPADISGSFFREQAIALAKRDVKISVIHPKLRSMRQWRSAFTGPFGFEVENDYGVQTYRSHGMAWFPRMPRARQWLWVREGRQLFDGYAAEHGLPDIIHVHSMLNAGRLALDIYQRYGIPYVITEHSSAFARGLISLTQIKVAKVIARHAWRRFAVSYNFCELLKKVLGVDAGPWETMPNIVDQRFLDKEITARARQGKRFRFSTVALLTESKCIHNLIQAFAKRFAGKDEVFLDVGGDGQERSRLEALVHELKLQNQVRFLGLQTRAQVINLMAGADAFVLPSRYETFGVVVIEALALGKPVIATRCGGPESILKPDDGVLVPPDDVDALAAAMDEVRTQIDRYDLQDIRARCQKRYSEDAVLPRLTSAYAEVIRTASSL